MDCYHTIQENCYNLVNKKYNWCWYCFKWRKNIEEDFFVIYKDKKNVVFIKVESFDYAAIDIHVTPTLHKILNKGRVFENYYTLTNNTNSSEFATLTSVPPIDNSKVINFDSTYDVIPKMFEEGGFCTFGIHFNTEKFYERNKLYPEIYEFQTSLFTEYMGLSTNNQWYRDDDSFNIAIDYLE